jgi:hypothetical protein
LNAYSAPPRVLAGQTKDQIADLRVDSWPTRLPDPAIGPLSSYQLPVPSQERLRSDHERGPPLPRKDPARRGQEHPIQSLEPRAARLASDHAELMAQDQDLKFLRAAVWPPTSQYPRERTHDEGREKEHRGIVEEPLVRARIGVSDPYGGKSTP